MESTPKTKTLKTECPKCGSSDTQTLAMARPKEAPKMQGGAGESLMLAFVMFLSFNIVAAPIIIVGTRMNADLLYVGIIAVLAGAVAAVIVGYFLMQWAKKQKPKREAAYRAATMKWQHSWLCLRCGKTFFVR